MCRALYTLAFGDLVSKQRAAEWAVSALPEEWRGLIEAAVAQRADDTPDDATIQDVLTFVQWVASEGETFVTSRLIAP
jgi:hypothetical protein